METLWLLEHEHKHGTDFAVHRTRAGAERAAVALVLDNIAAVDPSLARRLRQLALEDFSGLLALWSERGAEQHIAYFRIAELPLLP